MTLRATWHRTVRAAPEARALVEAGTGREWSRRELADAGRAWARPVAAAVRGRRVAFFLGNGGEWWRVFLGILEAGGVPVPLDRGEPLAGRAALAELVGAHWWWQDARLLPVGRVGRRRERGIGLVKVTSGSTGHPRALAFTDAQVLADGRQVMAAMGIRETDTNFALIPPGHSYGLGNLTVPLLAAGVGLVCGSSPWPQVVAQEVARWRPTVFPAVPPLLRALAAADLPRGALAGLRTIISAGAPLEPALAAAFRKKFGRPVHNFYGSSETGGIAYAVDGGGAGVGTLLPGVRWRARPGRRFEVASAAVFTRGNRRRAGRWGAQVPADRGWLTPSGELVLAGRVGRVVKIAGRRVDLAELEASLARVPGVREARVFFRAGPPERLAAAVAGGRPGPEVRAALQAVLPPWKIPRRVVQLAAFPVTARGKPDRAALEALVWTSAAVEPPPAGPAPPAARPDPA